MPRWGTVSSSPQPGAASARADLPPANFLAVSLRDEKHAATSALVT